MKLKDREGFWNKVEQLTGGVNKLKYIAQNDVELTREDLGSWLAECSDVLDVLQDMRKTIGDIQYEMRLKQ